MRRISIVLAVIFLALQYQIWFHNDGLNSQYNAMKQKAQLAEKQNQALTERNIALQAEVNDLKNGYQAITEIARSQLHYIQAGETFYKIQ